MMNLRSAAHYAIVFAVLAAAYLLVYNIHADYRLPYHVDEWQHIALAKKLMESGVIQHENPYFKKPPSYTNLEPGFHILLAELFMATGVDPVLAYRFLPALFASITALAVFTLVYKTTQKFAAGLFAAIFLASVRSNINIMGLWFFTPLTLSIPLLYLFFYCTRYWIKEQSNTMAYVSFIIFLALALIYPLSVSFITPIILVQFILAGKDVDKKVFLGLGVLVVLVVSALLAFIWKGSLGETFGFLSEFLVFEHGWGRYELTYFIPSLYGIAATLFAFIGLHPALKKKEFTLILWPLTASIMIYVFIEGGYSILVPYQRALYYLMLGLIPLSALGFYSALKTLNSSIKKTGFKVMAGSALVVLVGWNMFEGYYTLPSPIKLYQVIEEKDYQTLLWLHKQYGGGNVVLASEWTSVAVYPTTGNHVVCMVSAHLWGRNERTFNDFTNGNCSIKEEIIAKNEVDLIVSRLKIECPGVGEVYYDGRNYVYAVVR